MSEEDILFLIVKFGEKKHIEELMNGKLYTRRLKYYRNYEKELGDKSRGDINEGTQILNDVEFSFIDPKSNLTLFSGNGKARITYDDVDKMPVFCSCCILKKDLEFIREDEEFNIYELNFEKILGDTFGESYWDTASLIEPNYFFEQIKTCCEKENIAMTGEKVTYYDNKINLQDLNKSVEKDFKNIAFWKDNSYKKQKEHRILFQNRMLENNSDSFVLDVGSLEGHGQMYTKEELKRTVLEVGIRK
ncbi:hypothetical protein [Clostridium sp. HBUAS56017]|uniref:hypothetical protein n=1 Tax=Clostridium sp. HBUAS56017 TaxID=2571128 RepID=UPI0011778E26|nr:hypothetical protein [Clostridium sp. HBUAS56017]